MGRNRYRALTAPSRPLLRMTHVEARNLYDREYRNVPVERRARLLEQKRVDEIAASMLDKGRQTPILVRSDGARFVLVEGLHRLEAAKALGEKTIVGFPASTRASIELLTRSHCACRYSHSRNVVILLFRAWSNSLAFYPLGDYMPHTRRNEWPRAK